MIKVAEDSRPASLSALLRRRRLGTLSKSVKTLVLGALRRYRQ
jgi:hypothetical protein